MPIGRVGDAAADRRTPIIGTRHGAEQVARADQTGAENMNEQEQTGAAGIAGQTRQAPRESIIATRVTMHEAKRHFEAGGAVLVSEYGHEPTQTVHPDTTTHDRTRTTWDALAADVKEWRNRYPNQRFYIVPTVDRTARHAR